MGLYLDGGSAKGGRGVFLRAPRGSSLLEVLLVLTLLGIIGAIAMPRAGRSREAYQLETTARSLAVHMRMAQSHAVANGPMARLVFYHEAERYSLDLGQERNMVYLPEGIQIEYVLFPAVQGRPTLSFNFLGTPNQGGHVALKNRRGEMQYVIITPVTGRVRISPRPP